MTETVAFLVSDIEGSTRLVSSLGSDTYRDVLAHYREILIQAARDEDGRAIAREGDGLFLVFPTAPAALRAAIDAQRRLVERDWPDDTQVAARMAVHAGEATATADDDYVGLDLHRTARIAATGHGGQVLVSDAARALAADSLAEAELRDLGEHRLKDLDRPERIHQLVADGLPDRFPTLRTLDATPNNLPAQTTSFVGRERELTEVTDLIESHRLVTITGVGGAGKTRLALEVASALIMGQPDSAWFVELAPLGGPDRVPHQVAEAVGMTEHEPSDERPIEQRLADHLRDRHLLLILDNCEHVIETVGHLSDRLLRSCPHVRILATSREGLGIAGERIWQVPSMQLPDPDGQDVEATDAVRLFLERAEAVAASVEPTPKNMTTIARICRRLDGIPLAIELAATRVRVLGLEGLAERLDDRFRVLTGGSRAALPRQQTLAATIDWSYQLLDEAERTLFRRLSVFSGGVDLDAAERVCTDDAIDALDVLDLISGLVDKSMVTTVEDRAGILRYRMLETLRVYARDRLAESGESEMLRLRHRDHYLRFAELAEAGLHGSDQQSWFDRIATERDNLQTALDWSESSGHHQESAPLAYVLASYWVATGYHSRAIRALSSVLSGPEMESEREAELRDTLSAALYGSGDLASALVQAECAVDLVTDAEPSAVKVRALSRYAFMTRLSTERDTVETIAPAREAVAAARAIGDRRAEILALSGLGSVLAWAGDSDEGLGYERRALDAAREVGDANMIRHTYGGLLVHLEFHARRGEESREVAEEFSSWLDSEEGRTVSMAMSYGQIAYVFLRTGEWDRVETSLELMARNHLEGNSEAVFRQIRGSLRWMQGRLDEAAADAVALRSLESVRWKNYHLLPLEAEIAVLEGRLDDVRAAADEHLALEVPPAEEAMRTAVLRPLVHAEVDAAMAATGVERDTHAHQAREGVEKIKELIDGFPAALPAQFELPSMNLAYAKAELSRVTGPDPDLWRTAHDAAYSRYWQLYARWRLAESLLATDSHDKAEAVLRDTRGEASEVGAQLITAHLEKLAQHAGIDLAGEEEQ